ncbi:alpha-L-fucosidase [Solitalea koreensis]|uniref:alpha-L-fucosidase n=1 Tax=Solitalea koreensis TaxID=543615 RepID=A0A521BIN5_9SPHI|nr:alpha-L-fucosidase [Solitalea koreensis]SMO46955.1 alpha-L-fucosidase [Solitalea koreensis]
MKKKLLLIFLVLSFSVKAQKKNIKSFGPIPTKQQLVWHDMEYYWFIHFGPNTFTDKEWGHGDEPEDAFNPTQLDCKQWARLAKQAGAKGIILTAKHHDGFCLWPSKYSKHTVRESKWKNGKGDVVKDLSKACKEYGLKFGVYLSPWDRNHPQYGTSEYNQVYVNMMKELISNYGPFFEFWWDGANGEGPNGKKQVYNWDQFKKTMQKAAPNTVVFSDIGPHLRWVGNEKGIAGTTNWNLLDTAGYTPGAGSPSTAVLNAGNENGKVWIPAECDVSIRPGWFYHKEEDNKVKTPEQLFDLYFKSVGRGSSLLLNIAPDRRGLIHENDSIALLGFKKLREDSFKQNLALNAKSLIADGNSKTFASHSDEKQSLFQIDLKATQKINCVVLQEPIAYGQRVKKAKVLLLKGTEVVNEIPLTTIGHKRILTFPTTEVTAIRLVVEDAKATPLISEVGAYLIETKLTENLTSNQSKQ